MQAVPLASAMALLLLFSAQAQAQARREDVLRDLRAHGFASASAALVRLQRAEDPPGMNVPAASRAVYYGTLRELAAQAPDRKTRQDSMRALQALVDADAGCLQCRFELTLAKLYELDAGNADTAAAVAYQRELQALQRQLATPESEQHLLAALAAWARAKGELNSAIAQYVRAGELARKNGDAAAQVQYLANLIGLNADLGDVKRALAVGDEAYRQAEGIGYRALLASILLDIGHANALAGKRPQQREALEKALVLAGDDPGLVNDRIIILNNLADFWLSQPGGYPQTLRYARQALALARQVGMRSGEIAPLANIGIALAGMGQVEDGVAALRESLDLSKKSEIDVYTLGITQELVRVLRGAKRYEEALDALQSIIDLQEKQAREARETAVLELQEKYSAERKSDQIEKLAAQNKLKQSQLEAESWKQRLWLALAAILGLGLFWLWRSISRARRANRKLAAVNATLALQSATDPLTGAFNRRHTQALLETLQRTSGQSPPQHIGLILLDLDFFKRINDTHGHAAGDAVLVETVKRLQGRLRQNDVVSRWGGEEFVLVLPNTPAAALPRVARNVLEAIGAAPVLFDGQAIAVTVSLGVVSFPLMPGQTWAAALGLADSALYLAKASGRNQAICLDRIDVAPSCAEADLMRLREAGQAQWQVLEGPLQPVLAEAAVVQGARAPE